MTLLAALSACTSLSQQDQSRLRVFDTYVEALAEHYPFFAQKRIDWDGLTAAYRSAVVAAEEPSQFYHLLTGLLAELDDPHVSLTIPRKSWDAGSSRTTALTSLPGLRVAAFDRRIHVLSWPDGQAPLPPEHLPNSLRAYPEIRRVEGAHVTLPLIHGLLRGLAGSVAELQLQWADGTLTRHTLKRPTLNQRRRSGSIELPSSTNPAGAEGNESENAEAGKLDALVRAASLRSRNQHAVLNLTTFNPTRLDVEESRFATHLDALVTEAAERDALILDLRDNGGGILSMMAHFLGRFLERSVKQVSDAQHTSYLGGLFVHEQFNGIVFEPRAPRFSKPIVVLTSWRTGSAAELLTRFLQREAAAIVIGEQTIGAEALLLRVSAEDGTTLTFGAWRSLDAHGSGFQDEGITPDVSVRLTLDDLRRHGSFDAAWQDWDRRMLRAADRRLAR